MIMKKTMGVLTLIAGISLIGLACEATQIQPQASNGLSNSLSPACHRECHSKQCMGTGTNANKTQACINCCHKKHKNSIRRKLCLSRCPK
jgi:hypothetical protein